MNFFFSSNPAWDPSSPQCHFYMSVKVLPSEGSSSNPSTSSGAKSDSRFHRPCLKIEAVKQWSAAALPLDLHFCAVQFPKKNRRIPWLRGLWWLYASNREINLLIRVFWKDVSQADGMTSITEQLKNDGCEQNMLYLDRRGLRTRGTMYRSAIHETTDTSFVRMWAIFWYFTVKNPLFSFSGLVLKPVIDPEHLD